MNRAEISNIGLGGICLYKSTRLSAFSMRDGSGATGTQRGVEIAMKNSYESWSYSGVRNHQWIPVT